MENFSKSGLVALALVAGAGLATGSIAATPMAKAPAMMTKAAAPASLYCRLNKSGANVTVQVVNGGRTDAEKGTVFVYRLSGTRMAPQSYTLKWALGPQKSMNITKPMPAAGIKGCQPTA